LSPFLPFLPFILTPFSLPFSSNPSLPPSFFLLFLPLFLFFPLSSSLPCPFRVSASQSLSLSLFLTALTFTFLDRRWEYKIFWLWMINWKGYERKQS
jgi:hypothetical protein